MLKNLFGGKKEKFYAQVDESKLIEAPATPEVSPAPVETETPAAATPQATAPKSKKTSVKSKKTTATPAPAAPVVAPAPKKVEPTQVTFASTSPISQTLERRLPGPSLGKFKEMARQVKTR